MHNLPLNSQLVLDKILNDLAELPPEEALTTLLCGVNLISEYLFDLDNIEDGQILAVTQYASTQIHISKHGISISNKNANVKEELTEA
ncbi:hypothetical protein [Vibrio gallicus]|uniref:hypothetical protein n=1 Tax=Vibrio gallicus TaxID=190897 RepID=UPI0021C4C574|nr:hypothetical protein [Vibrio gallicus]